MSGRLRGSPSTTGTTTRRSWLASIARGLDAIESIDEGIFDALSAPRPSISNVVVPRLVQSLGERERPFVLVLDDLHALHEPESLEPLLTIAEHLPPGSHLALAARSEPPIRLGRLRANRRLVELYVHDLVMTRSEAAQLLRAAGLELGPGAVKRLIERTEGWPAALYLAALSLEGGAIPNWRSSASPATTGWSPITCATNSWSSQRPDDLEFLISTSVLDRLTGRLSTSCSDLCMPP